MCRGVFKMNRFTVLKLSKNRAITPLLLVGLLLATACSDSGDTSGTTGNKYSDVQTGVLLDSPVAGVAYSTKSQQGITGAGGEFKYRPDEKITFSIGDIILPQTKGAAVLTLLDLAHATTTDDISVINLARFLQTLDSTPADNIITVSPDTTTLLTGLDDPNIHFNSNSFASDAVVMDILSRLGKPLVDSNIAMAHFINELKKLNSIVGTWVTGSGDNQRVLIARDDNTYLYAECCDHPELERGTYYYQPDTGKITFNFVLDQIPTSGLDNRNQSSTTVDISFSNDTQTALSLTLNTVPTSLFKIIHFGNSIVGAWGTSTANSASIFLFTSDHRYFGLQDTDPMTANMPGNQDGIEYASDYAWDPSGNSLSLYVSHDTSGTSGMSESGMAGNTPWTSATLLGNGSLSLMNNNLNCKSLPAFDGSQSSQVIESICP